jgi:hypothetical protein
MDKRDWRTVEHSTFVGAISDVEFVPLYSGENFERALTIAHKHKARTWEREPERDTWIVSFGRPPYALSKREDFNHWTEV